MKVIRVVVNKANKRIYINKKKLVVRFVQTTILILRENFIMYPVNSKTWGVNKIRIFR